MPVISVPQFLAIADKLAAEYQLLLDVQQKVNAPSIDAFYQSSVCFPARLLVDLTGNGVHIVLQANVSGISGNSISFSIFTPSTLSSPLASASLGTELQVSLQTDANGNPISTPEEVAHLIQTSSDFSAITAIYPVTKVGGVVQPFSRTQFKGGVGTGSRTLPLYTLMTLRSGSYGNSYTITINQPVTDNQVLAISLNGSDLVINLATDGSGNPTTTVAQLAAALAALPGSSNLFQSSAISNFVISSNNPSSIVPAQSKTSFTGASNDLFANIVLTPPPGSTSGFADPDVAQMASYAQQLDTGVNAVTLSSGLGLIQQLQGALNNHFTQVGYPGGMQGYLTANNLLVHVNFSTIQFNRVSTTLLAANVFRPDIIVLASLAVSGSSLVYTPGIPLGSASGNQSSTNFGPQALIAMLIPAGGTLTANLSFTLGLVDVNGNPQVSNTISFTTGQTTGTVFPITASVPINQFYAVNGATSIAAGSNGDQVIITQVVQRQISL